mmetsp:Transcript_42544/g.77255  ORF Transcript_42544/g.77255 Transcript_42544/m.77255 type:complete len:106 (-) Transcript_42544:44-361(-)
MEPNFLPKILRYSLTHQRWKRAWVAQTNVGGTILLPGLRKICFAPRLLGQRCPCHGLSYSSTHRSLTLSWARSGNYLWPKEVLDILPTSHSLEIVFSFGATPPSR